MFDYKIIVEKLNDLSNCQQIHIVAGSKPNTAFCLPMGHGKTTYKRKIKQVVDVDDLFKPEKEKLNALKNAKKWKELLEAQRGIIEAWNRTTTNKL